MWVRYTENNYQEENKNSRFSRNAIRQRHDSYQAEQDINKKEKKIKEVRKQHKKEGEETTKGQSG